LIWGDEGRIDEERMMRSFDRAGSWRNAKNINGARRQETGATA